MTRPRSPTHVALLGTLAAALAISACSPGAPAGAPSTAAKPDDVSNHFILRLPGGRDVTALVGDRSITGPSLAITRYADRDDHAIRGDVFGRPLNVDVTERGGKGLWGVQPFDIQVTLAGDEMTIQGLVQGHTSTLVLSPRALRGGIGNCSFSMVRKGGEYTGNRGCGSRAQGASLAFPASFGKWTTPEMAIALAVLLSGGLSSLSPSGN